MEKEELKRKLFGLWEKTTHNSKEMLSVLFDYYFDINYIEYKELEGKVVCALCGFPFLFGYGKHPLKGLYIISLTTEEGFRKKGILADLLNTFNERMKEEFDFTFLVPPTALMADYYGTQGYFSSFFILEERFTPLHNFKKDYLLSLNESDERIRELKKELFTEIKVTDNSQNEFTNADIIKFIREIENKSTSSINLCHTEKDLEYILEKNSIKNPDYFIAYDSDHIISGVGFCRKEDLKRIRVLATYVSDSCSYYALLDFIKNRFLDHSISVNTSDPKYQMHSIIQQTYASENPIGGDLDNTFSTIEIPFNLNKLLQSMGMVRLLNFKRLMEYIAEIRSDADFKLYIRDLNPSFENQNIEVNNETPVFIVKNGRCILEYNDRIKNESNILNLTIKEVSELLLRKNDSSNLIMEAFGIPRLNLQMRLLPC